MTAPAIDVRDLTVTYRDKPALEHVGFAVPDGGSLVGIVGPNGAGKSTLLKAMLGLAKRSTGSVHFFGELLILRRKEIAYVPQRASVDWDFPTTLRDVVTMGTYGRLGWFRRPGPAEREACEKVLGRVGLSEFAARPIGQLSGGQQQRTFLARALVQNAKLLVMDEPFQGIDAPTEETIIGILRELKAAGTTILVVHHDLSTVADYFDRVLMLNVRLVAFGPTAEAFTTESIAATYGARITSPVLGPASASVAGPGRVPEPSGV